MKRTVSRAQAELEAAAETLETRARLLRIQARRLAAEAWKTLDPHLRNVAPPWLRSLLSRYALAGIALEYRDRNEPFVRCFSFAGPADYNVTLSQKDQSLYLPLLKHGYVPIGYESDGNLWVIKSPCTVTSPVFLLELSSWNGKAPTRHNGLMFAASRFALLLCSMGISERSYDHASGGVAALIWHEDREPKRGA